MKRSVTLLLLILLFSITFNSCKKSGVAPAQHISLNFNGTTYSSSSPSATFDKVRNSLTISASLDSATTIYIFVSLNNGQIGIYPIGGYDVSAFFSKDINENPQDRAGSGNITITSISSKNIWGNFQFT